MNFLNLFKSRPKHQPTGQWVAEAWLEWDICTGSTMYRERFDNKDDAERSVRRAAKKLDFWIPNVGCGIHYGVRKACEADNGEAIWSIAMPGSDGYRGEHWQSHPLNRCNKDRQAEGMAV